MDYSFGTENQLSHWSAIGYLKGAPGNTELAPSVPVWNVPESGALEARARAYLDVNCAHCHTLGGAGDTSGLFLDYTETDPVKIGINKRPVAAGRGSGGRLFDIKPGDPDGSIFIYRMESTDPGIMMPELGRTLVHEEGVQLIRDWIAAMDEERAER